MTPQPQLPALILAMELAWHNVIKGGRGDFTVCKFGLTRHCLDYDGLLAFARQVGVAI